MKILFIEDEMALLRSGSEQLELLGHRVFQAADLATADEILSNPDIRINLIIADHALPDGKGVEYAVKVRDKFPNLEMVIVSGCLTDKDIAMLEILDMKYFRKPLLYRKVIEYYQRKLMATKPVAAPPLVQAEEQAQTPDN